MLSSFSQRLADSTILTVNLIDIQSNRDTEAQKQTDRETARRRDGLTCVAGNHLRRDRSPVFGFALHKISGVSKLNGYIAMGIFSESMASYDACQLSF